MFSGFILSVAVCFALLAEKNNTFHFYLHIHGSPLTQTQPQQSHGKKAMSHIIP